VAETEPRQMYLVMQTPGPSWDPELERREQVLWDEHAAYMDGLAAAGTVVVAGPAGDGDEVLVLYDAPDEDAVRAILENDPWTNVVLQIDSIVPWSIWVDGRGASADR
jgi:uncharacterized protein YciI